MNRTTVGTAVALFLGLVMFTYAQQPTQDSSQLPQEQPSKQREVPPPPRQPEVSQPRGQPEAKPPKQPSEANPPKTEKQEMPPQKEQKPAHEQHGTAQQGKPAGESAHIPDPQFRANFSRQHPFTVNRVITTTTVVPNQTQFVLAGFTFIVLDPWPADWQFTDDCYIDYIEGEYFLFDVLHPGVRVALSVVG